VAFGWRATRTWADEYALLLKTIQFHLRNGFGGECDTRTTVTIDLSIDRDRPTTKLDIEGAEEQVLENGTFLARTEHIIVELHGHYGFQCFQRDIAPYGLVAQEGRPPDTYLVTARRPP
jgi:hypothetical protein